jgi:hypothetical protein
MRATLWSTTTLCALLLAAAPSALSQEATESGGSSSGSGNSDGPQPYRLHHRIYHPAFERPLFEPRGLVHLRGPEGVGLPFLEPVKNIQEHFDNFGSALRTGARAGDSVDEVLYQFALERPGDANHWAWDVSSVKACHLKDAKEEKLIVHLSPHDGTPYAIDYFISPIPHDGACSWSKTKKGKKTISPQSFAFKAFTNTTVELRVGQLPPVPALRPMPQLTPQGEVKQPEPEKTFIQKYWIYMVGVLIALLIAPGPDESEGGGAPKRPAQ